MLLKEAINLFKENMVITGKSKNTIYQYTLHLERFETYLQDTHNRHIYLSEVKPEIDLERFLFNILSYDKYSDSTRHGMITAFKALVLTVIENL